MWNAVCAGKELRREEVEGVVRAQARTDGAVDEALCNSKSLDLGQKLVRVSSNVSFEVYVSTGGFIVG